MNNITGTIINYYIHCKRQCYLHYHRINLEDESSLVKIGKALHERHNTEEIEIDSIKLDKIKGEFVTEIKKSDADFNASRFQLLFYLKKLKEKGIIKKGRLTFLEKNKIDKKNYEILLDSSSEKELEDIISEIKILVSNSALPAIENNNKCKNCAYYAFCYI